MKQLFDKNGEQVSLLQDSDIESSTNHIKFPDGTLIQVGAAQNKINESGVIYGSFSFDFPIAFINDTVFMFCSNIYANTRDIIYTPHPTRTGANIYFSITRGELNSGNSVYFKWIAIGRWK